LLLQPALLDACEIALDDIRASSEGKDIVVFVGAPLRGASAIYNSAIAICNGEILGVFPKTTPSSYTGARDSRYFSSLATDSEVKICKQVYSLSSECVLECESMPSLKIGVVIGDDALSFKSFVGGRC
jgi:NAD+ synthase (glutamine-hydrolysing)